MAIDIVKRAEKQLEQEEKKERRRERHKKASQEAEEELIKERSAWGKTIITWRIPEYEKHEHGRIWYIIAGIVIGLLLIFCFFTANLLFAIIIILTSFIVIFQHTKKPETYEFLITTSGIAIGNRFYSYDDFDNFWLAYQPPLVKTLYFTFKSVIKPEISVPLGNQNPLRVREILLEYLDENLDREDETTSDALRRLLKI